MLKISQHQVSALGGEQGVQACPIQHWIEIELIDELDQPRANERYLLSGSDDSVVRSGNLDPNGFAREEGLWAKDYKISFPDLDKDTWKRI